MADHATNEYLNTENARKDENDLFAAIGKKVLSLKLGDEAEQHEDERVRIVDEIESLFYSHNFSTDAFKGITWLLLIKIPFFREIILMSFYCDNCHLANNEIQPAEEIQERGSIYTLRVEELDDLERRVVKSDTAVFRIEDLDLEVPAGRGRLTNLEGILGGILKDLEAPQKRRKKEDPGLWAKVELIIQHLLEVSLGHNKRLPCTVTLDDPAGNSWIEPTSADSSQKGKYACKEYSRTPEQNKALGLGETDEQEDGVVQGHAEKGDGMEGVDILEDQVYDLLTECPGCAKDQGHAVIQVVNIPHFKQVILWNTHCTACEYTSTEVKTGGEVSAKGQRMWLDVRGPKDLGRDILMSETCLLTIPDFEVSVEPGTLGGRFTTVEGLLTEMRDQLKGKVYGLEGDNESSDSRLDGDKQAWTTVFARLDQAINAEIPYTILLEDPLHNSYCQSLDDLGPRTDSQIRFEEYERTKEDDDLGLTDVKKKLNEDVQYVRDTLDGCEKREGATGVTGKETG